MIFASPKRACLALVFPVLVALALGPALAQMPQSTGPSVAPAVAPTVPNASGATLGLSAGPLAKTVMPQTKSDAVATTVGMPILSDTGLRELSPWSMFLAADVVVKAVMIGLTLASLATWTILIAKTIELALARRGLAKAIRAIGDARTIPEARVALRQGDFMSALLAAATRELEMSGRYAPLDGIKERSDSSFAELVRVETQAMRRGMGVLATIGSTAPFVGLFGTVWGIMNSFIGISKSQTTNLAVVAPGIAEALLATAVGLVAAIPAVIIYNHFSRSTRSYQLMISRASGLVTRLLSRELDLEPRTMPRAAE